MLVVPFRCAYFPHCPNSGVSSRSLTRIRNSRSIRTMKFESWKNRFDNPNKRLGLRSLESSAINAWLRDTTDTPSSTPDWLEAPPCLELAEHALLCSIIIIHNFFSLLRASASLLYTDATVFISEIGSFAIWECWICFKCVFVRVPISSYVRFMSLLSSVNTSILVVKEKCICCGPRNGSRRDNKSKLSGYHDLSQAIYIVSYHNCKQRQLSCQ